MPPGADELVLKLVLLKCGWLNLQQWQDAVAEHRRQKGNLGLTRILTDSGLLTPEQARLVVDPLKRKDYLKQLVDAERKFWEKPPGRIGRYPVLGLHARGGRAVIFRGERDGRPVAIKVLSEAFAFDLEELERFQRQRDFGLMLDHPNLIKVHDAGWEGTVPFLVMGWVEGQPLSQHVEEGRALELGTLVDLFTQACRGLAHAHERGILHKDLKPDNLLVDRMDHLVVSDFGVAQRLGEAGEPGIIVGTPAYMSPEQAGGRDLDARTDVFSLGAALYECLTRSQPFKGENRYQVLEAAAAWDFRPPRALNPGIPEALEAVVLKAMARRPQDRYAGMGAFEQDLLHWEEGRAIRARRSWLGRLLGREK